MSRPANPPEVHIPPRHGKSALTGMFGDPDSWDALHNDVDGAAVSVPDDPATLRARLEERYERPERPCTYDPADEEPEAEPVAPTPEDRLRSHLRALAHESQRADDWTPPRPEPVEYSGIPVVVDPKQEEGTVILVWKPPTPAGIVWTRDTLDAWQARHDAATEAARAPRPASEWMDLAVAPQGEPDPINPTDILYPCECGARGIHVCPLATRYPSDMLAPPKDPMPTTTIIDRAILEEVARDLPKSYASVTGWTNQIVEDPSNGPRMDRSVAKFMERVRSAALLRSYLRTLTNPDAPAEDVAAALDLLTDEDFALVDPRNVEGFKLLAALPLMKRVRVAPTKRNP